MRRLLKSSACSNSPIARRGMSTASFIVGSVLWIMVLTSLGMIYTKRQKQAEAEQEAQAAQAAANTDSSDSGDEKPDDAVAATTKTIKIGFPTRPLPDFEFPECMGGTISKENMKGKRWVANFVFTRCAGPCPVMTRDMSLLHKRVAKTAPDFQFVTFSVDSSFDNAEVLKKYAETFQADHARWKFVTGDEDQIHDFIRRGFALYVKANVGDMRKPGFEVAHSNRAVVVNEDGLPVASFLMNVPEDVVKLRRIIEGTDEFPKPGPLLTIEASGDNPDVPLTLVPAESTPAETPADTTASPDTTAPSATSPTQEQPKTDEPSTPMVEPKEQGSAASANASAQKKTTEASTAKASDPSETGVTPEDQSRERNKTIDENLPSWLARLPTINAGLNTLSTLLLLSGYAAIRAGNRNLHRNLMIVAFLVSVVFLGCYLTYHEGLFRYTGQRGRAFMGPPAAKLVYLSILCPHIILAVFVPILAIRVFVHAFRERWIEHRKLAKITFPIWLFVSITGVIIYAMLYHYPAS